MVTMKSVQWHNAVVVLTHGPSSSEKKRRDSLVRDLKETVIDKTNSVSSISYRVICREDLYQAGKYMAGSTIRGSLDPAVQECNDVPPEVEAAGSESILDAQLLASALYSIIDKDGEERIVSDEIGSNACMHKVRTQVYILVDYPLSLHEAMTLHAYKVREEENILFLDGVIVVIDPLLYKSSSSLDPRQEDRKASALDYAEIDNTEFDSSAVCTYVGGFLSEVYQHAMDGNPYWTDIYMYGLSCPDPTDNLHDSEGDRVVFDRIVHHSIKPELRLKQWAMTAETVHQASDDIELPNRYTAMSSNLLGASEWSIPILLDVMLDAIQGLRIRKDDFAMDDVGNTNNQPHVFPFQDWMALQLPLDNIASKTKLKSRAWYSLRLVTQFSFDKKYLPMCNTTGSAGVDDAEIPEGVQIECANTETALRCFTGLSRDQLRLNMKLMRFKMMLGNPLNLNILSRDHVEQFDQNTLPQRLASVASFCTNFSHCCDELSGHQLLAASTFIPANRHLEEKWSACDSLNMLPLSSECSRLQSTYRGYFFVDGGPGRSNRLNTAVRQLQTLTSFLTTFYPSNHSIIKLQKWLHCPAYLTVDYQSIRLSLHARRVSIDDTLASSAVFSANFSDNRCFSISMHNSRCSERPQLRYDYTSFNGLLFTISSDSCITQYATIKNTAGRTLKLTRSITRKGVVISIDDEGMQTMMIPNGWTYTKTKGSDRFLDRGGNAIVKRVLDAKSLSVVEQYKSGVVTISYPDGSISTYYTDGTILVYSATTSILCVINKYFVNVSIVLEFSILRAEATNAEAFLCFWLSCTPKMTVMRIKDECTIKLYHSEALPLGEYVALAMDRSDGVSLRAFSDGQVRVYDRDEIDIRDQIDHIQSGASMCNVYYFYCCNREFALMDNAHNQYHVSLGDKFEEPTYTVDLLGSLSHSEASKHGFVLSKEIQQAVRDPIEPYLFVLRGDGTGAEVLRHCDLKHFISKAGFEEASTVVPSATFQRRLYTRIIKYGKTVENFDTIQPLLLPPSLLSTAQSHLGLPREPYSGAKQLSHILAPPYINDTVRDFVVIRNFQQLAPLTDEQTQSLIIGIEKIILWKRSKDDREVQYRIADTRNESDLIETEILQKKVVSAYKASNSRRLMERTSTVAEEDIDNLEIESVWDGCEADVEESCHEDKESHKTRVSEDKEDIDSLMCNAFQQFDVDAQGLLSSQQARSALAHAAGLGITVSEIEQRLKLLQITQPYKISFAVFADLVRSFQLEESEKHNIYSKQPSELNNCTSKPNNEILSRDKEKIISQMLSKSIGQPAGTAIRAVWYKKSL